MIEFDFSDLSANYDIVVFDSSIPILSRQDRKLEKQVRESNNAVTVPDVLEESELHTSRGGITESRLVNLYKVLGSARDVVLGYIVNFSLPYRIIDSTKKLPLADIKVAALALGFANNRKYVSFVSGDRALNKCLFDLVEGIKDGSIRDFPLSLNELDIYSLLINRGKFVLYWQEAERGN